MAYGHLIDQFWTPEFNHPDNDFAGGLEGRLEFIYRLLESIRQSVGPDFIVGIRMTGDDFLRHSIRLFVFHSVRRSVCLFDIVILLELCINNNTIPLHPKVSVKARERHFSHFN